MTHIKGKLSKGCAYNTHYWRVLRQYVVPGRQYTVHDLLALLEAVRYKWLPSPMQLALRLRINPYARRVGQKAVRTPMGNITRTAVFEFEVSR